MPSCFLPGSFAKGSEFSMNHYSLYCPEFFLPVSLLAVAGPPTFSDIQQMLNSQQSVHLQIRLKVYAGPADQTTTDGLNSRPLHLQSVFRFAQQMKKEH